MKRFEKVVIFVLSVTMLFSLTVYGSTKVSTNSKDLKISIGDTPSAPFLKQVTDAMQSLYTDGKITVEIVPSARGVADVESGVSDAFMPILYSKTINVNKHIYSTKVLYKTTFILYSNKSNKDININNMSKYKVEVLSGNGAYFNNIPETDPSGGLQKANSGRTDGFIGPLSVDGTMKELKLTNLKRTKLADFDVKAIFPNNARGKQVQKIFDNLIAKLYASGKYQIIMKSRLNAKFIPDPK